MGGGLIQLVAYGAQDVYLTGNPQITFFKVVYRRYTNFAMESIEQTFNGTVDFGKRVTCTISRNGDLVHRMYLQVTLPEVVAGTSNEFAWVDHVGLALIKSVEIEIGGQKIDKHYGEWMYIWNELTQSAGKKDGYDRMTGHTSVLTSKVAGGTEKMPATTLFVPLEFWFCRNPGLALPLIALQYHEVKINMEFRDWSDVTKTSGTVTRAALAGASLWADYIFLDTDERRRFAQSSHEFLIEQLQFTGDESITGSSNASASAKVKLSFNHPCKEFVWIVQRDDFTSTTTGEKEWFNFSTASSSNTAGFNVASNAAENPVASAKLQLNGHDRFTERSGDYFSLVQPYQHHENVPTVKGINVYSFALKPEEHQPSGTLNCSRIDTSVLQLTLRKDFFSSGATSARVKVYATSYNVLRVMSGMGGLAYSS